MKRVAILFAATGLLCLGVVVGTIATSVAPAQEKAAKPDAAATVQKWEYKLVEEHPDEKKMNKLGEEGWELVFFHGNAGPVRQFYKRPKR